MTPRPAPPSVAQHAVGEAIAAHRKAAGRSQAELARLTGIDRKTLGRVESGQSQPSAATLRVLAKTLGLTVTQLQTMPNVTAAATNNPALMTTAQVSDYLQVAVSTLKMWRGTGTGPAWFKANGMVRYRRVDVDAWIAEQYAGTAAGA